MCQRARLVLAAGHCHENAIFRRKHFERFDRAGDLFVDKRDETGLAKGGIVARETDHRARTGRAFECSSWCSRLSAVGCQISARGGVGARCCENGQPIVDRCELSAGNDWPDFNLVAVGQDLIFRDEFITPV